MLDICQDFVMWVLVIGGVSLYGLKESWLCNRWQKLVLVEMTWYEAQRRIKSFLRVDVLHDKLGKEPFNYLNHHEPRDTADKRGMSSPWWLSGWGIWPLES
jgi:hypothetical protein